MSTLPIKGCVLEDLLFVFGCKIRELIIHLIEEGREGAIADEDEDEGERELQPHERCFKGER